jgi:hypothetical protein
MKRKPQRGAKLIRPASPAEYQHARVLVEAAVANHVVGWAKTIALTCTDARFDCFREDVIWALDGCMRLHIFGDQYRPSDFRRDLLAIYRAYIAAAKALRKAQAVRARCFPLPLRNEFQLGPLPTEHQLMARAEAARLDAEEWKYRHPSKMPAFAALAMDLAQAFQNATGQPAKVTWNEYRKRYEGMFFGLVEAILPTAREVAETVTGRPLPVSRTVGARGKFLQRLTALRPKDKTHLK